MTVVATQRAIKYIYIDGVGLNCKPSTGLGGETEALQEAKFYILHSTRADIDEL